MTVAIRLTGRAYLPEAHAYHRHLVDAGIEARLVRDRADIAPEETAILFSAGDLLDRRLAARRRIHEYHVLSGGRLGRLKDLVKTRLAAPPDGLIIQEGLSLERLAGSLPRKTPRLVRRMGIDEPLFDVARDRGHRPDYDLVYCGSIERVGLAACLETLAERGFRIICFGNVPDSFPRRALEDRGISFGGPLDRAGIPGALANARAGLNWMPDRYPVNVQESTKTIEYAAAGLPTLSNRYAWARQFATQTGAGVAWLDNVTSPDMLDQLSPPTLDLSDRAWPTLLEAVSFEQFIRDIAAR